MINYVYLQNSILSNFFEVTKITKMLVVSSCLYDSVTYMYLFLLTLLKYQPWLILQGATRKIVLQKEMVTFKFSIAMRKLISIGWGKD